MNETIEFLNALYSQVESGWLEITYLAPHGQKLRPRVFTEWLPMPLELGRGALQRWRSVNASGYGVHFGCAVRKGRKDGGRGKQEDALCVTALWCDVDDVAPDDGCRRLIAMPLQPSIIVSSGGGVHGYWLIESPLAINDNTSVRVRRALHGIANAVGEGGDANVRDLARVMRLPGTINTKRGAACKVVDFIPMRYHFSDLERVFSRFAPREAPVERRAPPLAAPAPMPRWVQVYLETGAREGERNKRAYAAARALLDAGFSAVDVENLVGARAAADGLDAHEIKTLLRSAANAPRSAPPMPSHMRARMAAADFLNTKRQEKSK